MTTSCYSNGSDRPHHRRRADQSVVLQVAPMCTSLRYTSVPLLRNASRSVRPFLQGSAVRLTQRISVRPAISQIYIVQATWPVATGRKRKIRKTGTDLQMRSPVRHHCGTGARHFLLSISSSFCCLCVQRPKRTGKIYRSQGYCFSVGF